MILLGALEWIVLVSLGTLALLSLTLRSRERTDRVWALRAAFALWISSLVPILGESDDWLHLFWMAQIALVGLFLLSGAFLFIAFEGEPEHDLQPASGLLEQLVTPRRAPWWFLAMMTSLAVLPLFLIACLPFTPADRNIGAPIRRLTDLVQWGFGAALPECLTPNTFEESARGVGHLPREVTVPMGTILIASWLWIAFCALALVGRILPWPRLRRPILLLSPLILGVISFVAAFRGHASSWWFDPRFFWPTLAEYSGIWTADPLVMKSFGPLLLIAFGSAIVLAILVPRGKAPRTPARHN
ncbi:MAG: hypothetical protein ABI054_14500 [Planctomycetota bacterium]